MRDPPAIYYYYYYVLFLDVCVLIFRGTSCEFLGCVVISNNIMIHTVSWKLESTPRVIIPRVKWGLLPLEDCCWRNDLIYSFFHNLISYDCDSILQFLRSVEHKTKHTAVTNSDTIHSMHREYHNRGSIDSIIVESIPSSQWHSTTIIWNIIIIVIAYHVNSKYHFF